MSATLLRPMNRTEIDEVVGAATLAPSIMNCQPWRFHAYGDVIDVRVERDRLPAGLDPTGREVLISIGAALLNLRLAMLDTGRFPRIQLLPEPDEPGLAARVSVGGPAVLGTEELALHRAIPGRRSSRTPFDGRLVPFEDYLHLQDAAQVEGTCLDLATGNHRAVVADAVHRADRSRLVDPSAMRDLARWTVDRPTGAGIPDDSLGPRATNPAALVSDMSPGRVVAGRAAVPFETDALLAVLLTTGDGPMDWLRAGLGLERVLLTATARGLSVGLLSDACEQADIRPLVSDASNIWRNPQIVLRLGYGDPMPVTPRFPVEDVLVVDDLADDPAPESSARVPLAGARQLETGAGHCRT